MIPDRDVTRLPKWAQQEIERLGRDLASAHKRLDAGPEDSNVFAEPYSTHPRPLGKDTSIEFRTADGKYKVDLEDTRDGQVLEVYGGDTLQIEPRSSNVVRIRVKRF